MEVYRQITLDEWTQWKEDIRRKLAETACNFVYIGYRLKQIRDSGMYDGAADIFEFAEKEYRLGKSTVSRFIAINEKYSEGGNSLELKKEFRGLSSSMLAEMLTLPDSEVELITEKTTIREIRALKAFNKREPGKDMEAAGTEQEAWTPIEKCLIDYFKDKKDMLNGIMKHLDADPPQYKEAAEDMAPSQTSHQKGIAFIFMYDWSTGVKCKLMTEQTPITMTWQDVLNIVYGIYGACDKADVWADFYKAQITDLPQSIQASKPVATSQQNEEDKADKGPGEVSKDVTKKPEEQNEVQEVQPEQAEIQNGQEAAGGENEESRENETQETDCADGGQTEEPAADPEPTDTEDGAAGGAGEDSAGGGTDGESGAGVAPVQPGEQLEGQMDITEYPEYMPDAPAGGREDSAAAAGDTKDHENPEKTGEETESAEAAGAEDPGAVIRDADGLEQHIANQKRLIKETLQIMGLRCDEGEWDGLAEKANEIIVRAENIKNMEEMWDA